MNLFSVKLNNDSLFIRFIIYMNQLYQTLAKTYDNICDYMQDSRFDKANLYQRYQKQKDGPLVKQIYEQIKNKAMDKKYLYLVNQLFPVTNSKLLNGL